MVATAKGIRRLVSRAALSASSLLGACSSWGNYDGSYVCGTVGGAAGPASFGAPVANGPPASLTNGQPPTLRLGLGSCTPGSLCHPMGMKVIGGALYVASECDHRVLVWNSLPTQDNQVADRVLGQPNLTQCGANHGSSMGGNTGPDTLNFPTDVASDGKVLVVLDHGNNRMLIFDPIPTSGDGPSAKYELNAQEGCSSSTSLALQLPQGMAIAGTRMVVADTGDNRTFVWDNIPTASSPLPSMLLGQASITSCTAPTTCGALTSQTQSAPSGVWTDGTRLAVADTWNNRVLLWASFPTQPNQTPDLVLGPTLTGAGFLNAPAAVTSNGNQLVVADSGNSRVLVWNALPTTSSTTPDAVLGQPDFSSTAAAGGLTGLSNPSGLLLDATGHLWVSDTGHGRVVRY